MVIKVKGRKRKISGSNATVKKGKIFTSTPIPKGSPEKEVNEESVDESLSTLPRTLPATAQAALDSSKVKSAVKAVFKLIEEHASQKTTLFSDDALPIHMQVTSVKVAATPERQIRFVLPHPVLTDSSDVCLFVADLKKGKKEDHEPTVAHYQDLLDKNGVTGITQIIPVRQLKVEYDQYEMKRRLCDQFDYFLSEGKVSGHVQHLIGKSFVRKRKYPTPVNLNAKNLKSEIKRALSKTVLTLHGKGNSTKVVVGHSKQSPTEITENIVAIAGGLAREFPGGWDNVRSLSLKSPHSLSVPFYMTLKSSNLVDVPVIEPKRPKLAVPVEDELSTIVGARVRVLPSGEVTIIKDDDEEDSGSELDTFIEKFNAANSEKKTQNKKKKTKKQQNNTSSIGTEDDNISEDDEDDTAVRQKIKNKKKKTQKKQQNTLSIGSEDDGVSEDEEDAENESDDETAVRQVKRKKSTAVLTEKHKKKKKKAKAVTMMEDGDDDSDDDDDEKLIEDAETAYLSHMLYQHETSSTSEKSKEQPAGELAAKKKKNKRKKKKNTIPAADGNTKLKKKKLTEVNGESKSKKFSKANLKNSANGLVKKNKKQKMK